MVKLFFCLLLGYLIGSVNFAIVYSHLRRDDIRRHGSGNAGATNVLRTYGAAAALFVFLFDVLKGVMAVLIVRLLFGKYDFQCAAALGAVLGHNFPLYYKFCGGKGVSTSFAVLLVLDWRVALCALCVFLITLLCFKYVSLSSVLAAASIPVSAFIFRGFDVFFFFTLITGVLCIARHHANIKRLMAGNENKLGAKK